MRTAKLATTLALSSLIGIGCANQKDQASAAKVTTSFMMTGSASSATVAKTNLDRWIQRLIPSAQAYIPSSMVDAIGSTVTLNTAWVIVKEVEFEATEVADETESDELQFEGPYYVDLLDTAPTALDTLQIPEQVYRRIKMKFENDCDDTQLPAGAPAELGANSMVFKGSVGPNNFSVLSDDGVEMEVGGAGGISPSEGQQLLLSIQLANIVKQIDLSAINVDGMEISSNNRVASIDPCPSIDASANDLYTCFKKGFEQQADLGKDEDGDGELEVGEDHVED